MIGVSIDASDSQQANHYSDTCAIIFAIIGDPRFFTDGRHIQRRQRASSWIGEAKISDWICKLAAGVNKREMPSVLEYEHLMPPLSPQDPNCDD